MPLSEEEALLRVAFLVARADGHASADEARAAVAAVAAPRPPGDGGGGDAARMLQEAASDVWAAGEEAVLGKVLAALPGHGARLAALKVACRVAGADDLLKWTETSYLAQLAGRLRLSKRDVAMAVRSAR